MSTCDPGSRVDETGLAFKGSMLQLQLYVNQLAPALNSALSEGLSISDSINWVSPIAGERYAEYRDESTMAARGLQARMGRLETFWPKGGPMLGRSRFGRIGGQAEAAAG